MCISSDAAPAVYVWLHNQLLRWKSDCCTAVTKVPRGAQDFPHVVSHESQTGSTVRAFTECTCWRVCTRAGHARACDTPTRFATQVLNNPVLQVSHVASCTNMFHLCGVEIPPFCSLPDDNSVGLSASQDSTVEWSLQQRLTSPDS